MNSQQLILDRIAAAIEADERIVLIRDSQYSNTGTLRTLDADTLRQIAAVSYNFQQGYCHFGPVSNYVAALWYGEPVRDTHAPWVKGSIPDLVDAVVAHLTTVKVES